jgi:hypothetical protein
MAAVDRSTRPPGTQEPLATGARRIRCRRIAPSGALALTAVVILWPQGGGSPAATAATSCVISVRPAHDVVPHDVAAWAQGRRVVGEGSLWTTRAAIGVPPRPDGTGWLLKFPWLTRPNGLPRIEGHRLNGPGVFQYDVNRAYDARGAFNTSTLHFSTRGCWQVTGRYGTSTLRFTLRVGGS